MKNHFDAVILGGGVGGLALAALLSHRGMKILLLERNNFLGGRCTSYEKEGFVVDAFIHMFGRCEKGPYGEIMKKTGAEGEIRFWHPTRENPFVLLKNGRKYPFPNPAYQTPAEMEQTYRQAFAATEADIHSLRSMDETIAKMKYSETFALDDTPMSSFLKRFPMSRELVAFINQQVICLAVANLKEASAGELIRVMAYYQREANVGYPLGGCKAIPEGLARIARRYGAELQTGVKVERINVEKGLATGVELKDGTVISAPLIISNIGVKETVLRLLDPATMTEQYRDYAESLSCGKLAGIGTIAIHLALDKPVIPDSVAFSFPKDPEIPSLARFLMEFVLQDQIPPTTDPMNLALLPVSSNMDPSLAPQGKQIVHLPGLAPLESAHWKDWVNFHVDYLDTFYPGLKNHILWYDFGTTSMINHYSGRFQPDIVGLAQIIGQVGKSRPPLKSPYENLYFVGSDTGSDNIGTELAAESALRLADLILKKP